MGIKVSDLDKTEAWTGGALLPVGRHAVRIDSVDDSTTSRNGHPQLVVEMSNEQGNIKDWIVVTPAAYGGVKMFLEALGFAIGEGDWETPEPAEIVGRRALIQVTEEPNKNDPSKMRKLVASYMPVTAAGGGNVEGDTNGLPEGDFQEVPDEDIPF